MIQGGEEKRFISWPDMAEQEQYDEKLEKGTLRQSNIAGWKMDPDWRCIFY